MNRSYSKKRHIQEANILLENRTLINEDHDYDCLLKAGFVKVSVGGPMTKSFILEKTQNDITYQIGIDKNNNPYNKITIIKLGQRGVDECASWECDSKSKLGITYSECKTNVIRDFY